jgi:hypothetical protein
LIVSQAQANIFNAQVKSQREAFTAEEFIIFFLLGNIKQGKRILEKATLFFVSLNWLNPQPSY